MQCRSNIHSIPLDLKNNITSKIRIFFFSFNFYSLFSCGIQGLNIFFLSSIKTVAMNHLSNLLFGFPLFWQLPSFVEISERFERNMKQQRNPTCNLTISRRFIRKTWERPSPHAHTHTHTTHLLHCYRQMV